MTCASGRCRRRSATCSTPAPRSRRVRTLAARGGHRIRLSPWTRSGIDWPNWHQASRCSRTCASILVRRRTIRRSPSVWSTIRTHTSTTPSALRTGPTLRSSVLHDTCRRPPGACWPARSKSWVAFGSRRSGPSSGSLAEPRSATNLVWSRPSSTSWTSCSSVAACASPSWRHGAPRWAPRFWRRTWSKPVPACWSRGPRFGCRSTSRPAAPVGGSVIRRQGERCARPVRHCPTDGWASTSAPVPPSSSAT